MLRVDTKRKKSGFIVTRSLTTFKEAKNQLLDEWENEYLKKVLERAGGNPLSPSCRYGLIWGKRKKPCYILPQAFLIKPNHEFPI